MKIQENTICGWSRSVCSKSKISLPETIDDVLDVIKFSKDNRLSVSIRGAGLSYGDNTLNTDEMVLCTKLLNKIVNFDSNNGTIIVESGVTIEDIYLYCIEYGWMMPVMPGTRYVTIGGALGNNIHGKNCEYEGNIGEHVICFDILLSSGDIVKCSREENSDIFYTAISGIGLIGVITTITLQLREVPSNYISGQFRRADSIDHLIELYEKSLKKSDYSIATIDAIAKGSSLGKGMLHFGSFIKNEDFSIKNHKVDVKKVFGVFPRVVLIKFARTFFGKKLIEWYFRMHSVGYTKLFPHKKRIFSFSEYHFLMDNVLPDYNLFHKDGFYEYQVLIPKAHTKDGIRKLIEITHKYEYYSIMTSLKAYREQKDEFVKSFHLDGYGITLDIRKVPHEVERQRKMFLEMNDLVLKYKGKQHLAKTPIIEKEQFELMYPSYERLIKCKEKHDKINLFRNDMCRRIFKQEDYKFNKDLQLRF
jgi:FAD/FMN-containing dehydrogenase